MILVKNLKKSFGSVEAVRDVSFEARPGRITGILGPNGAGKSTTLRMISGLLEPDAGEISVCGLAMTSRSFVAKEQIGVLADARGLYPRLSARENIAYFARLRGMPQDLIAKRLAELAAVLEMESFLDRRTQGFSTGQKLKVAIARMLIHEPATIIFDEPSSGLDVIATRAMRGFIKSLSNAGRTILLTSHVMQEIAYLCDDIVVIDGGLVVAQGEQEHFRAMVPSGNVEDAFIQTLGRREGLA